jgi:NAD(P) transhydrogenase
MSKYSFDLLCIGSGPAGHRAAIQAAKLGKRAAVVEKRQVIGGVCVDTGTIPSKTFREAVLSFVGYNGLPGLSTILRAASRPTAAQLLARVQEVVKRESEIIEDNLWRNDLELIRGEASFLDPHTVVVKNHHEMRTVGAEHILVAVGTRPAPLPCATIGDHLMITSDQVLELEDLPRKMTVVGGGVTGLEYASMFSVLGIDVTLVDKRVRLLEFLDEEIVDELTHQMRNHDVTFRLGEAVENVTVSDGPPRQAEIHLESGKRILSDLVLFTPGRIGETDCLNLQVAGLTADDRGRLAVDSQFRTKVPHIFAAGDVIGFPGLAATSSEQGRIAACHALGVQASPMAEHFPIGIYSIPEVSMVGATEQELTKKKVPYEVGMARYKEVARGQIIGDHMGMLKLLFDREDKKLLGVHAIGTGATELIHVGQAILGCGKGLEYFLNTVFNYPTLAECYKVAAFNAWNKLGRQPFVG